MPRKLATAAGIVGLAFVITVALFWLLACHQRKTFEELAKQFSALQVGNSTFTDAQQLADRYRPYVRTAQESCTAHSCEFRVLLANFLVDRSYSRPPDGRWFNLRLFRRLGIRPAVAIATATVEDGKVRKVNFAAI